MLDDGIYILAYFHKDSVTSCKGLKKIGMIKKDCDNWKKIVIIEKDCNNWKRLW